MNTLTTIIKESFNAGRLKEFQVTREISQGLKSRSQRLARKIAGQVDLNNTSETILIQKLTPEIEKIFEFIPNLANDAVERDKLVNRMFRFMDACETGIVKFQTLLQKKTSRIGCILSEEAPDYFDIYALIEARLLSAAPSTGGAGSWGPGELGLSLIGAPVKKAENKGDLIVDNKLVELKASKSPSAGGRLNTDAISSGANGRSEYEAALRKLIKDANMRKPDGTLYKFNELGTATDGSSIKIYNFGPKFISILNERIRESSPDPQIIKDFLKSVVLAPVIKEYRTKAIIDWIDQSVNPVTAEIIPSEVVYGYIFMLASYYLMLEKIEVILVLNPVDGSFHVSNSPKDLVDSIKLDILTIGSTYIDFTQNQGKASPQIGIATLKERQRKEKLKQKKELTNRIHEEEVSEVENKTQI
jgi:hypothetical protein